MIKKDITPFVRIYKNLFKNINNTLDVVKKSIDQNSDLYIKKWYGWEPYGIMSSSDFNIVKKEFDDGSSIEQYSTLLEINSLYKFVAIDYLQDKKDFAILPKYINEFELKSSKWINSEISILKHELSENKIMQMDYHTDEYIFNSEARSNKFILTINFYLNDDYMGGEISFTKDDEDPVTILNYKPEAGDIVVYPSFNPYFHGVAPLESGEKYLIRTFLKWDYEGSEDWLKNETFYTSSVWSKMQDEFEKSEYQKGKTWRHFVKDGQKQTEHRPYTKQINNDNIKYLNGRDINE